MSAIHAISYGADHRRFVGCCHRARCACGWWSDSYAAFDDARRAGDVHLRRARREEFDGLIARSSIGAAMRDIGERGIDAHLVDLEQELRPSHRKQRRRAK